MNTLIQQQQQQQAIQFVLDLIGQLYKISKSGNLVVSPYSLTSALTMLLPGTDGNSRLQLVKTLFDPNAKSADDADKHLQLFADQNMTNLVKNQAALKIANMMYSHKSFPMNPEYVSILTSQLRAIGKQVDFSGAKAEALQVINSDVDQATKGLIPKLLDDVNEATILMLVNAIYFKGLWAKPFEKELTNENGEFRTSSGKVITAPLMSKFKPIPYYFDEASKTKAVQLDYQADGNIAMVLILPDEGISMETFFASHLTAAKLAHLLDNLHTGPDVRLTVPRFHLSATHKLVDPLAKLGLVDLFDSSKANLSRIAAQPGQRLVVSEVIQKAVIEVNEEGTEAAAATAIGVMLCSAIMRPVVEFTADRPFMFALITKDTPKQVLFIGVVEDPTKKE